MCSVWQPGRDIEAQPCGSAHVLMSGNPTHQEFARRNSRLINPLTIGVIVTEVEWVSQLLPLSRRRRLLAGGNSD